MGGTTTTVQENELPLWYQQAAMDQINLGKLMGQIGYVPYIGADVAAWTPQEIAGMQGASEMARAFGMPYDIDVQQSLPLPSDFGGGITAYSAFPQYEEALRNLRDIYPAQAEFLASFSMDPIDRAATPSPWDWAQNYESQGSGRYNPYDGYAGKYSGGGDVYGRYDEGDSWSA